MAVTILYEDSQLGQQYPLHDLILQMVLDDSAPSAMTHWALGREVLKNAKKGVDALLHELPNTSLIAGDGLLYALVDRDKIIDHINKNSAALNKNSAARLPPNATEAQIEAAMADMSDAPDRLRVFFLDPNIEGLIASLAACAPGRWAEQVAGAARKRMADRDYVLKQAKIAAELSLRQCIRRSQRGLDALVLALIEALALAEL